VKPITLEPAVVRRLIDVVFELTNHDDVEVRTHAREIIREISECVVTEVFAPILTRPREQLLPFERLLRNRLTLTILNKQVERELEHTPVNPDFDKSLDEAIAQP
jgi:hypothetical protein